MYKDNDSEMQELFRKEREILWNSVIHAAPYLLNIFAIFF